MEQDKDNEVVDMDEVIEKELEDVPVDGPVDVKSTEKEPDSNDGDDNKHLQQSDR